MDIDELIKREAPNCDTHDIAYSQALRGAYEAYRGMNFSDLRRLRLIACQEYDSTHSKVASCVVLYELVKEGELLSW